MIFALVTVLSMMMMIQYQISTLTLLLEEEESSSSFAGSRSSNTPRVPKVLTGRPSWTVLGGWYKSERQCRKYAAEIREHWRQSEPTFCGPNKSNDDGSCPYMVHTELLHNRKKVRDSRQEQIPVLSFLVTQPSWLKLNIVVGEQDHKNPPDWLAHLLRDERYRHRLQITYFDFMSLKDLPTKEILAEAFQTVPTLANKSDLRRFALLYNYGGLWFDTDTVFINDVSPLMGLDFVYVAGSRYNGAVMGASVPKSRFMRAAIEHACDTFTYNKNAESYYKFAHDLFRDLIARQSDLFSKLSGCLFECGWGGKFKNGPEAFVDVWAKPTTYQKNQFFLDPEGVFSFHWHGHWGQIIEPKSLGSVAHANYVRQLEIDPKIFLSATEDNWANI